MESENTPTQGDSHQRTRSLNGLIQTLICMNHPETRNITLKEYDNLINALTGRNSNQETKEKEIREIIRKHINNASPATNENTGKGENKTDIENIKRLWETGQQNTSAAIKLLDSNPHPSTSKNQTTSIWKKVHQSFRCCSNNIEKEEEQTPEDTSTGSSHTLYWDENETKSDTDVCGIYKMEKYKTWEEIPDIWDKTERGDTDRQSPVTSQGQLSSPGHSNQNQTNNYNNTVEQKDSFYNNYTYRMIDFCEDGFSDKSIWGQEKTQPNNKIKSTHIRLSNKFDGRQTKFLPFVREYANTVYKSPKIRESTKLEILANSLTGNAKDRWRTVIKPLITTEESFEETLTQFIQIFFDPFLTTHECYIRLCGAPIVKRNKMEPLNNLLKVLTKFHDTAKKYYPGYFKETIPLQGRILAKFGKWLAVRNHLERKFNEIRETRNLSQTEQGEQIVKYTINFIETKIAEKTTRILKDKFYGPQAPTEDETHEDTNETNANCELCEQPGHRRYYCSEFQIKTGRIKKKNCLKKSLCIRCLGKWPHKNPCNRRCRECRGKHHEALCLHREHRSKTPATTELQQIHQQFRSAKPIEDQNSENIESQEETNKPRATNTVMYTKKTSPYIEITEIKETQIETVRPNIHKTKEDETKTNNNKKVKFNEDMKNIPENRNY